MQKENGKQMSSFVGDCSFKLEGGLVCLDLGTHRWASCCTLTLPSLRDCGEVRQTKPKVKRIRHLHHPIRGSLA